MLPAEKTPFGKEVDSWIKENRVAPHTVLKIVGVEYLDRFHRLLDSPNSMLTLDFVFRMSHLTEKSPVVLLRLLYENQENLVQVPLNERERAIHFLLLFDRFFRLKEEEQNTILLLCQSLYATRPESFPREGDMDFLETLQSGPFVEQVQSEVTLQKVAELGLLHTKQSHVSLGDKLGVGPYYLKRLFLHASKGVALTKSIYLPIVTEVSALLKISPIRFLLLLYTHHNVEERTVDRLNTAEERLYALFSRFIQLAPSQQGELIVMADSLLRLCGQRQFSGEQLEFINNFRVQPLSARRRRASH